MINYKVLKALEEVDGLIKEEIKESTGSFPSQKENLRAARDKVQEAITHILKSS